MSEVILFIPRRELGSQTTMHDFIVFAREQLTIFGSDLPFDAMSWEVTRCISLKAKKCALRAIFSTWESVNDKNPSPMPSQFGQFAKSYFRYQHGLRPTKSIGMRITALRALCSAHQEFGGGCPSRIDVSVFNRAAQLIKEKFSASTAYRTGTQLEMVSALMDNNQLASVSINWKNTLSRPTEEYTRVGEEFERRRQEKLPSPFQFDALARAFRAAQKPVDVVVTSVAALMCSAPDRVNEVLSLREGCEITSERKGGEAAYGLRFWPSKRGDPMVKWLVPSMNSVAIEAIARLRAQSESAREVARWYEKNPTSMYLPSHLSHLRGKELAIAELGEALFVSGSSATAIRDWCWRNRVSTYAVRRRTYISFAEVEAAIISMLPPNFPYVDIETGLLFSEALCIARRNEFHSNKATYWGVLEAIDQGFIATGLGNRSAHGFSSVFDSLGLFNEDGSAIAIRSHQFRHYLNTLAHRGGMSELDIAKWSGRRDIRQNSAYNHVSDRDLQSRLKELRDSTLPVSSKTQSRTVKISFIPRNRIKELNLEAAHTTEFGYCAHDYVMSPCQLHADCINCNEQVCVKGDREGELNAQATLKETQDLLAAARASDKNGVYGASQWVIHQELTLQRVRQLIDIFENPAVPFGSIIQLTYIKPASRLGQAVESREALGLSDTPRMTWQVVHGELPR